MAEEVTAQQMYNDYAEQYRVVKGKTIENILEIGKITYLAKKSLSHGMFLEFLNDFRVNESVRTAQRFLAIHSDFGHLLEHPDKLDAITCLGVTNLLTLKKLPDRFKKEIEVVFEKDGEEQHEMKKVIDEDKLTDFLDTPIEFNGKMVKMKDLPVPELNKQVRIVNGIFEPDSYDDSPTPDSNIVDSSLSEEDVGGNEGTTQAGPDPVRIVLEKLSLLLDQSSSLMEDCDKIDDVSLAESSEGDVEELRSMVKRFKSNLEAIYIKLGKVE